MNIKTNPSTSENAKLWKTVVEQKADLSKTKIHKAIAKACAEHATSVHLGNKLAAIAIDKTRDTEKKS